jgi:hypothetical protein
VLLDAAKARSRCWGWILILHSWHTRGYGMGQLRSSGRLRSAGGRWRSGGRRGRGGGAFFFELGWWRLDET